MEDTTPYSNREIREKWNDIQGSLDEILAQTKRTNGRVNRLEIGFIAIIAFLIGMGIVNIPTILSLIK